MLAQLTSSVQWVKSVEWMEAQGVTEFLEFGPKDVLTGLNKRIAKTATTKPIGTVEQIEKFLGGTTA
jgi:[acyl-carrier-protein] S-malonyltransferase